MPPQSNHSSNSSNDSLLARAFEESIRLQRHQEHSTRERELRELQREEHVLEESRRTFLNRALEEENEEEAQLRLAMERSATDEQDRAERRAREREERTRLDREFGSGGSSSAMRSERPGGGGQNGGRGASNETAPAPVASPSSQREGHRQRTTRHDSINSSSPLPPLLESAPQENLPPASGRQRRNANGTVDASLEGLGAREALENRENRHHPQSRAQDSSSETGRFQERPSRAAEAPAHNSRQGRRNHEATQSRGPTENNTMSRRNTISSQSREIGPETSSERMPAVGPPRRTNSERLGTMPPFQVPGPNPERRRQRYPRHQRPNPTDRGTGGPPPGPSSYTLPEILARSRRDAYQTNAPFTENGLEFNHHELQAAINASADQGRDPDEEAVERNLDCPTYEEACAMRKYKPRRGDSYVFQGPNAIMIEGDEDRDSPNVRMEIVGEMDLAEAMRVANGGRNRNRPPN